MESIHAETVTVDGIEFKVEQTSSRTWHVTNLSNGNEYDVVFRKGKLECHCQGFIGHHHCHHVTAVAETLAQKLNIPKPTTDGVGEF